MIGWHHQLNGRECEQILRDGEGQRSLACCISRVCKELDMTQHFNSDNNSHIGVEPVHS